MDTLCGFQWFLKYVIAANVTFLILGLLALTSVNFESASGIILLVDFGIIVVTLVPALVLSFYCSEIDSGV